MTLEILKLSNSLNTTTTNQRLTQMNRNPESILIISPAVQGTSPIITGINIKGALTVLQEVPVRMVVRERAHQVARGALIHVQDKTIRYNLC